MTVYAAYELANSDLISVVDHGRLDELHEWFAKHMQEPTRATASSRPHAKAQALSWFKETAVEHVSCMRLLSAVLADYDIPTVVLRTDRPGYVVYEDRHQVLAMPFADTPN